MARPSKNNPNGEQRKYKKTKSTIQKVIEGFKMDFTLEEVCAYAGISDETYYNWIKDDQELFGEIQRAKQYCFTIAKKAVKKGLDSNPDFALRWLSKRQKDVYADRVENTGANGGPLQYSTPSDDEINEAIDEDAKQGQDNVHKLQETGSGI